MCWDNYDEDNDEWEDPELAIQEDSYDIERMCNYINENAPFDVELDTVMGWIEEGGMMATEIGKKCQDNIENVGPQKGDVVSFGYEKYNGDSYIACSVKGTIIGYIDAEDYDMRAIVNIVNFYPYVSATVNEVFPLESEKKIKIQRYGIRMAINYDRDKAKENDDVIVERTRMGGKKRGYIDGIKDGDYSKEFIQTWSDDGTPKCLREYDFQQNIKDIHPQIGDEIEFKSENDPFGHYYVFYIKDKPVGYTKDRTSLGEMIGMLSDSIKIEVTELSKPYDCYRMLINIKLK